MKNTWLVGLLSLLMSCNHEAVYSGRQHQYIELAKEMQIKYAAAQGFLEKSAVADEYKKKFTDFVRDSLDNRMKDFVVRVDQVMFNKQNGKSSFVVTASNEPYVHYVAICQIDNSEAFYNSDFFKKFSEKKAGDIINLDMEVEHHTILTEADQSKKPWCYVTMKAALNDIHQ